MIESPREIVGALWACCHLVEETGLECLAARMAGDRKAERRARTAQDYWSRLVTHWRACLETECKAPLTVVMVGEDRETANDEGGN